MGLLHKQKHLLGFLLPHELGTWNDICEASQNYVADSSNPNWYFSIFQQTKQNKTKQNKTKQNKTKQNKTKTVKSRKLMGHRRVEVRIKFLFYLRLHFLVKIQKLKLQNHGQKISEILHLEFLLSSICLMRSRPIKAHSSSSLRQKKSKNLLA